MACESLSTAKRAAYRLALTNSTIGAADQIVAPVAMGSATNGAPVISTVTLGASQVVIVVQKIDGTNAFNGTCRSRGGVSALKRVQRTASVVFA